MPIYIVRFLGRDRKTRGFSIAADIARSGYPLLKGHDRIGLNFTELNYRWCQVDTTCIQYTVLNNKSPATPFYD